MHQPTPQLDYAPRPLQWYRRPMLRRWVVRAALLAVILFAGFGWGPSTWRQVQLLNAQRQCMNYQAPASQLIYSSDPNPDEFARTESKAFHQTPPPFWSAMEASLPAPVSRPENPDPYLDSGFSPLVAAPVFLHRRNAPGKPERLIVVLFGNQPLGGKEHRVLCCRVIQPATLFHGPLLLCEESTIVVSSFEWTSSVSVYAGKADDGDSTHFTIETSVNGVINCWLQADDTVKLVL